MPADELIDDPGVLDERPVCELQGWRAAARTGGVAILPWRGEWLAATRAGVEAPLPGAPIADGRFDQCLVHLQKSRPGTWRDLAEAWRLLRRDGRLLLCGGNELGISSAVKRLGRELGQRPIVLANRRRARIVSFRRDDGPGPERPEPRFVDLPLPGGGGYALEAEPGVFSTRRLDAGSEILLSGLPDLPAPKRVLDIGCGIGPLACYALALWPGAQALMLDGDARAIRSAHRNAQALGLADRCDATWWDASEPCPEEARGRFDLVLTNPPFHTGKAVDLAPARGMFRCLAEALAPGGSALVVANRTLPYEADLDALGSLRALREERGYKLLSLKRSSRSGSSRRRYSPGSRSSGRL